MKKFLVFLSALLIWAGTFAHTPGNIDEKTIRSFENSFPEAQQVQWQEQPDFYVVSFYENDILSRVIYRKDGSYIHLVRYYEKQLLPFYVSEKVNRAYPGKQVFGVVEVSLLSGPDAYSDINYYITLEDSKHWVTVKADSHGNMMTVKKIRKAL